MEHSQPQVRRSRMHRQPTACRIALTVRDLEILSALARYRYLRSSHLYALVGGRSRRRFVERLGLLYHEGGYVNRPARQWQVINARYMPAVYELTDAGERVLIEHGHAASWSPLLHRGRGAGILFQHELMVSDILSSIEIGVHGRSDLRFVSWQEILDKAPDTTRNLPQPFDIPATISHKLAGRIETCARPIKPDAVFGLEYRSEEKKSYRFFALEADRANEPVYRGTLELSSYLRKLLQYCDVLRRRAYRSHLGIPNLQVLTVTTAEPHMRAIMACLGALTEGQGQPDLLFYPMPSLASLERAPPPTPFILDASWARVGCRDASIDRPQSDPNG